LLAGLSLTACSDAGGGAPVLATGVNATDLDADAWSARDGWMVARILESTEDLNGDDDTSDAVLVTIEARTGSTSTIPVAAVGFLLAPPWLAFQALEREHGDLDLNGDGDVNDSVLFVHDLRNRATRNLRLALPRTPLPPLAIEGDLLAFLVSETDQGADLDGNGKMGSVLHVQDLRGGSPRNLGFACSVAPLVAGGRVLLPGRRGVLRRPQRRRRPVRQRPPRRRALARRDPQPGGCGPRPPHLLDGGG
jgi:hypothetical protein